MLVKNLLGARYKETPKDCVIASHALMMKGGYMILNGYLQIQIITVKNTDLIFLKSLQMNIDFVSG